MDEGTGMPSMGDMGDMLDKLQKMQSDIEAAQAALAEDTVEVSAGGGGVKVVMSGTQVVRRIEIAPELLEAGDAALIEDAVLTAVNEALQKSQALAVERLGGLGGGFGAGE